MLFQRSGITFQEVPNETSLYYEISGCPLKCDGCHSPELRLNKGKILDVSQLSADVFKYDSLITCVLFMGGDWSPDLVKLLKVIRENNLKTALYSGQNSVSNEIQSQLDYLKTGPFLKSLGGLNSPLTNQKIIHVPSSTILNHLFL